MTPRAVEIPRGTRHLLITCAAAGDPQFRGVERACRLLAGCGAAHHIAWRGDGPLALGRRRALRWVAVSGHGAKGSARISDGLGPGGAALQPRDLRVAKGVDLYLLACHQGTEGPAGEWAARTKATVHGCGGETESALSALFLLALLEHGPDSAARWFGRWREANDRLRPDFPRMRRIYRDESCEFAAALDDIAALFDLGTFADILAVARRYGPLLDGLA